MPDISIKKAAIADLPLFDEIREQHLPNLHKHRLDEQSHGLSEYLIFFENESPVAHIYVSFKQDYPNLQDLFVKKDKRNKGLAKKVIEITLKRLKKAGYKKVGIDVETKLDWVHKLYENCGFSVYSGPNIESWVEKDSGKKITVEMFHLQRDL